jgi:predicted amidophosphoribosyltransferase
MPHPNKWARYRARLAGELPPVPLCPTCSRQIRGAGRDGLCSRCWAATPSGREDLRQRVARSRSRRRASG